MGSRIPIDELNLPSGALGALKASGIGFVDQIDLEHLPNNRLMTAAGPRGHSCRLERLLGT